MESGLSDMHVPVRREFVTGFRKRKQQRRKEAIKSLEKLQRENVLEERAEVGEICVGQACCISSS